MKKFLVFILILCTILYTNQVKTTCEFADGFAGVYCFYTTENFESNLTTRIKNGNGFIVSCDIDCAGTVKNMLNKNLLFGESFSFVGNEDDIKNLLFDLDVCYTSKNENELLAYSPKLDYSFVSDGKEFNVQIAENKGVIYVGFPTIFGGF